MSDEKLDLVPFNANQLPAMNLVGDNELAVITKGADYLQRLQLVTKGKYVDTGKIAPGRYGVPQPGGEEITDLGPEIDLLPLAVRAKALDMNDKEAIIACYDATKPEFARIKDAASKPNSGCMYGPSFLIFERSTGEFYEYFMGNKSARNESGKVVAFLATAERGPLPMTLRNRYATAGDYGWHVPVAVKCSEPFTNLPPMDKVVAVMEKFAASKEENEGMEKVEEPATGRAR